MHLKYGGQGWIAFRVHIEMKPQGPIALREKQVANRPSLYPPYKIWQVVEIDTGGSCEEDALQRDAADGIHPEPDSDVAPPADGQPKSKMLQPPCSCKVRQAETAAWQVALPAGFFF